MNTNTIQRLAPRPYEDASPIGMPLGGSIQSYVSSLSSSAMWITPQVARESPTVYACVRLISKSIARMPKRVRMISGNAPVVMADHILAWMLNVQPNAHMTGMVFWELMLRDALLFGNGFAFIHRAKNERPVALGYLRPDLMFVSRDEDNCPTYTYHAGTGGARTIEAYDIFHLKGPSNDGLLGEPPIFMQREIIALELLATRYAGSFFRNGARPSGVVKFPYQLTKDAIEKLRDLWYADHGGAENAHRVAILDNGADFVPIVADNERAQLVELRAFCRQQIAAMYGVPPHMIGDSEKQSYASAEQADLEFVKHCLGDWAARFESECRSKLFFMREPYDVQVDFDDLLRGDLKSRADAYRLLTTAGVLSVNDCRSRESLPPIDGGEVSRVPINTKRIDTPDADPNAMKALPPGTKDKDDDDDV